MERLLWVCFAGALGSGARYLIGVWAVARFGNAFPCGTLIVNVVGCFLMAVVMRASLALATFPENLRFALATGFIGGLTTYSSFNYETTRLVEQGTPLRALANLLLTLLLCGGAGLFGLVLARRLFAG
ncbi:MAG TPA: fluoride efflux transporter CrcB [Polyangiaceae bacterium]|nr:fluoride efflux transporter CrcB [Polyangiaceae bacterium]